VAVPILLSTSGAEPLSVSDARDWLRLEADQEADSVLSSLITAARLWFEAATDRQLTVATYELRLPAFSYVIELPYPPLVSVLSVQYLDVNGVLQTQPSSTYVVVTGRVPAQIVLSAYSFYPATYVHPEAVRITYTAGAVNELLKTGIKLLLAHLYENRGEGDSPGSKNDVPPAVKAIAWAGGSYRVG